MQNLIGSHPPTERYTTEPTARDDEPDTTNNAESSDQPVSKDCIYGTIVNQPLETPASPFFTERPLRDSDSPESEKTAEITPPALPNRFLEIERLTKLAIDNNFAYMSFPPEMGAESHESDELTKSTPPETSSTFPDELPPKHE